MNPLNSPHRILLIDNHKLFRQGIRLLLERCEEFQVVDDADGSKVLANVLALKPTIVLIDLLLPRFEDGLRILAELVGHAPDVRVIVLTVPGSDEDVVYHALRSGAAGCVVKSTSDFGEVAQAIQQVGQGQLFLSPSALQSLVETISRRTEISANHKDLARAHELSPREREVLELVAVGHTNREIADRLLISESTVRSHLHNILDTLQLSNRVQVAAFALQARQNGHVGPFLLPRNGSMTQSRAL